MLVREDTLTAYHIHFRVQNDFHLILSTEVILIPMGFLSFFFLKKNCSSVYKEADTLEAEHADV